MTKAATATKDDGANEPTFIAQCPKCNCLIACVVVVCDDEAPWEDERLADALTYRAEWKREGLKVSTVTVRAVREWPKGRAFTHARGCSRDKRRKFRKSGHVQAATPLLSGL